MKPQELTGADRAEKVAAILATVTIESGPPRGEVDESDGNKWPHVAFTVTLKRNGRAFFIGPYKFGVGHFNPKGGGAMRYHHLKESARYLLEDWARKPRANFSNAALWAEAAAEVAKSRGFSPKVPDVLPALLSDGSAYFDAETFPDWCGNFGYNSDSIKARDTFDACDKIGRGVARAFTAAEIAVLREWGNEQ